MRSSLSPVKRSITRIGLASYPTEKIRRALRKKDSKFFSRFTSHERSYCHARRRSAESFAARFAAKTAFWDALDIRDPLKRFAPSDWRAIGVERKQPGPPTLAVTRPLLKKLGLPSETRFLISITHERDFAVTVLMLEYSMKN